MHWTTDKPTEPGWYWLQQDSEAFECVGVYEDQDEGLCCNFHALDDFIHFMAEGGSDVRWSSAPIPEPEEQP